MSLSTSEFKEKVLSIGSKNFILNEDNYPEDTYGQKPVEIFSIYYSKYKRGNENTEESIEKCLKELEVFFRIRLGLALQEKEEDMVAEKLLDSIHQEIESKIQDQSLHFFLQK